MNQTIGNLESYVRKIASSVPADDEVLCYRGHADQAKFMLHPHVLREDKLHDAEHLILRELIASQPGEFAADKTTLDYLVRVQHYYLPTRLLDVTWNPLVALYFAAQELPEVTGEVILFRIKKQKIKFFDSDTLSCIANLAHLKTVEKNAIDFSLVGNDFNDNPSVDRLLQFIREEKPHFRAGIIPSDLKTVLLVKPKQNNQRIMAQAGAFLLFGLTGPLDTDPIPGITMERITIKSGTKELLLRELDLMRINDSTMFPGIEKAARYIKSKILAEHVSEEFALR